LKYVSVNLAVLVLSLLTGCVAPNEVYIQPCSQEELTRYQELAQEVHERVNVYRMTLGLRKLRWDPRVGQVAQGYSEKMARTQNFSHDGFKRRAAAVGRFLPYRTVSENLARNWSHTDPVVIAMNSWLGSPSHRGAIENAKYLKTGVGVAKSSKGKYYFTQIFVLPR
jgi:uncharacterized protein YkwD